VKTKKILSPIFIGLLLTLSHFAIFPNIPVVSIAVDPDQFISEIFPNSTLPLHLSNTNTIIDLNATDFPKKLDLKFDANYTIFNLENTSNIPIILPFSLDINIMDFDFEVYANDTQIPYEIFNVSPWNENITAIDINLAWFRELYPIRLIYSNVTLPKNSTTTIMYHISGPIINPLNSRDLFSLAYHLRTSQDWIGNTTGKIEFRAYGQEPIFGTMNRNPRNSHPTYVDIDGGKSLTFKWNNVHLNEMQWEVRYYREVSQFDLIWSYISYQTLPFIGFTSILIIVIIKRKRLKKEVSNKFENLSM
jgi:hypothetical protein